MTCHHYANQTAMGPDLVRRLQQMASEHGCYSDSYLVTETDREYFWLPDHDGVIGFVRLWGHFKIIGGLIAPGTNLQARLLASFIEFVKAHRGTLAFYNIGEADLPVFDEQGFRVTKWGEEAILDLPGRTWRGKEFERMRQQVNFCRRQGLVASEVQAGPAVNEETARLHAELLETANLCLRRKPQAGETRLFQAALAPGRDNHQRIFVSRAGGGRGRIESFIICFPGRGARMWSSEIYRHRPDCVRNALVFLIYETAELLKSQGIEQLTLGFIAGLRCNQPRPKDSAFTRWGIDFTWRRLGFIFDLQGVYAFKNRFRPRYENRYCCVWPAEKLPIGSTIAFLRLWRGVRLSPIKTVKTLVRHAITRRRERKTLAPENEP